MANENIKRLLDRAWKAYDEGKPFMPDSTFDALSIKYDYNDFGSLTDEKKGKHLYPMYSLKKVYDDEKSPYEIQKEIESPKLDGTAISLLYEEGYLVQALRRGRDGIEGEYVTDKMALLVPLSVDRKDKHQIDGEVVCDKSINNARNFASGSFTLRDIDEFKARSQYLKFVAYSVRPYLAETYEADMALLYRDDLSTVLELNIANNHRTDGIVYRENNNKLFFDAGYTSKHPRASYARKQSSSVAIEQTKLLNVTWQVGRSGKITPVANFEEIVIDDAKITKATLHNAGFIEEMQLDIGDIILVTRSGAVIPKVLGKK